MNRLELELQRLYLPAAPAGPTGNGQPHRLVDASGAVRALVLALARPADWAALAEVWKGVQTDLDLPAPAISVSGTDALRLWFSLAQAHAGGAGRCGAGRCASTLPERPGAGARGAVAAVGGARGRPRAGPAPGTGPRSDARAAGWR